MNKYTMNIAAALFVSGLAFASNPAYGESHSYDFQANAKMQHKQYGLVDKAYGLVNVVTDNDGKGTIDVMFSNGSQIDWAKFNARLKFVDASGTIIKQEHIYRWLDAAGEDGATERKVSKSLTVFGFETIEVEFYLTDIPETGVAASDDQGIVRVSSAGNYF